MGIKQFPGSRICWHSLCLVLDYLYIWSNFPITSGKFSHNFPSWRLNKKLIVPETVTLSHGSWAHCFLLEQCLLWIVTVPSEYTVGKCLDKTTSPSVTFHLKMPWHWSTDTPWLLNLASSGEWRLIMFLSFCLHTPHIMLSSLNEAW